MGFDIWFFFDNKWENILNIIFFERELGASFIVPFILERIFYSKIYNCACTFLSVIYKCLALLVCKLGISKQFFIDVLVLETETIKI